MNDGAVRVNAAAGARSSHPPSQAMRPLERAAGTKKEKRMMTEMTKRPTAQRNVQCPWPDEHYMAVAAASDRSSLYLRSRAIRPICNREDGEDKDEEEAVEVQGHGR